MSWNKTHPAGSAHIQSLAWSSVSIELREMWEGDSYVGWQGDSEICVVYAYDNLLQEEKIVLVFWLLVHVCSLCSTFKSFDLCQYDYNFICLHNNMPITSFCLHMLVQLPTDVNRWLASAGFEHKQCLVSIKESWHPVFYDREICLLHRETRRFDLLQEISLWDRETWQPWLWWPSINEDLEKRVRECMWSAPSK